MKKVFLTSIFLFESKSVAVENFVEEDWDAPAKLTETSSIQKSQPPSKFSKQGTSCVIIGEAAAS